MSKPSETKRFSRRRAISAALVVAAGAGMMGPASMSRADTRAYEASGMASWYGARYHGRVTANGEKYDMHAMTAAHRTLPFGSLVQVTNVQNGKSIKLRINDRGPYVGRRIIDVSKTAARELDFLNAGLTRVHVQVVGHAGFRRLKQ